MSTLSWFAYVTITRYFILFTNTKFARYKIWLIYDKDRTMFLAYQIPLSLLCFDLHWSTWRKPLHQLFLQVVESTPACNHRFFFQPPLHFRENHFRFHRSAILHVHIRSLRISIFRPVRDMIFHIKFLILFVKLHHHIRCLPPSCATRTRMLCTIIQVSLMR